MKHKKESRQIGALRRREADVKKYAKMLEKADKDTVFTLDGKELTTKQMKQKLETAVKHVEVLTEKLQKAGALNV